VKVIRSRNVLGHGAASIAIEDGRIAAVSGYGDAPADAIDYGGLTILPGLVDSHVHVNEPGRTDWEGFATATRAAAAGGVTTIVDMPLNSIPPTTSVAAFHEKASAMRGQLRVDVALWGGAVPGNADELLPMLEAGARGFKCFMVDSGVPEFGHLDAAGIETAMRVLGETSAPLLLHAELGEHLHDAPGPPASYARYLASRPATAEDAAIELVYALAKTTGAHAHIVHLSSAGGLAALRRAREEGVRLTAETTPHYLFFEAETIPDAAPQYKCAPPIREHANRELLWRATEEGLLAAIVSDHSPCTPQLKLLESGDVEHAWGGIASLQFGFAAVWTEARRRGVALETIVRLMSEGPARLAGLSRKGRLAPGYDADLVVLAPDERFRVERSMILHRHPVTPYEGRELLGVVKGVYLRGEAVNGEARGTLVTC
jgi:allantoinase